jgi:hypothetical protein
VRALPPLFAFPFQPEPIGRQETIHGRIRKAVTMQKNYRSRGATGS